MYSRVNLSSGRAGSYFTRDYITQSTGHWFGKGADRLGLSGIIKKDQWDNNINGRDPEGRQIIQNGHGSKGNQDRRSGMDNCFSAPKDVSVLASKEDDVVLSHDDAVKTVLSNMEEKYSYARKTVNGITRPEQTGNLVFGVFRHFCSRYPYDPQLHSHSFESNMTQREDGEWRAIYNNVLFQKGVKHHIGLMYRTELAANLREIGYEIETDSRGFFRILGMPKEITDHFSRRKAQVEEKYQELRKIYPHANEQKLKEMAALGSRSPKKDITLQDLRESWDKQITELGFSWEKIREDMRHEADIVRAARNKNVQITAHDYVRTAA
ncbi:MAG TPA: MobF family relaxase, partial [Deltaproteobacteria bacterium]|nr:MobF family relaxase [Deltaproteobacteria bacterium]